MDHTASESLSNMEFSTMQNLIAKVWGRLLGNTAVLPGDNFFDLGGDSLKATMMLNEVAELTNTRPSFAALFQAPTLEDFSNSLERVKNPAICESLPKNWEEGEL